MRGLNEVNTLIKEAQENSFASSATWKYNRRSVPRKRALTQAHWHSYLGFPAARTVRSFCCFYATGLVFCYSSVNGLRHLYSYFVIS